MHTQDPDLDADDTHDDMDSMDTLDVEHDADAEVRIVPEPGAYEPTEGADQPDAPPQSSKRKAAAGSKRRSAKRKAEKSTEATTADATGGEAESDAAESEPGYDESIPEYETLRFVRFGDLVVEYRYWINPRLITGLSESDVAELAASIAARTIDGIDGDRTVAGIARPLEVVQISSNGSVVNLVIDGQRRFRAMESLHFHPDTLVPVQDLEPIPVEWSRDVADQYLKRVLSLEGTKRGLGSFELVESAMRLREAKNPDTGKDHTLSEIASVIGRSESWVSKMLTARANAKPALVLAWKNGSLTDEQFKDLAAVSAGKQKEAMSAVVEAAASGDKQTARTLAKEQVALAKRERAAAKGEAKSAKGEGKTKVDGKAKGKRGAKGEQTEIDASPPRKPPPKAVVEDLLAQAEATPPTHDYVKGIIAGVMYATGGIDPAKFAKPWVTWLALIEKRKK